MNRNDIEKLSEASKLSIECVEKFDKDVSGFMEISLTPGDEKAHGTGVSFEALRDDVVADANNMRFFSNVPNEKNGYILTARVEGV